MIIFIRKGLATNFFANNTRVKGKALDGIDGVQTLFAFLVKIAIREVFRQCSPESTCAIAGEIFAMQGLAATGNGALLANFMDGFVWSMLIEKMTKVAQAFTSIEGELGIFKPIMVVGL